jgi:hypothetical protein
MFVTLAACATSSLDAPAANSLAPRGSVVAALGGGATSAESGSEATAAAPTVPEETVDISELDTGLVCKYEKRPGSRIAEEYCYTREERAANQEAQDKLVQGQMNALARDQEQRVQRERDLARSRGGVLTY